MRTTRTWPLAVLLFAFVCLFARAVLASPAYSGGTGTSTDPYRIATKRDLLDLGATPDDYDKHFVLTADIDLAGETFTTAIIAPMVPPQGRLNVPSARGMELAYEGIGFSGVFDGDGYIVRNLRVDMDGAPGQFVGLFGQIKAGGEVADVGIVGSIDGGDLSYGVGLLAGESLGSIRGCFARGSITIGEVSTVIGGLCGHNDGAVADCYAMVTVSLGFGGVYGGGFCAINTGTIATSYSTGSVGDTLSSGGFCGDNLGTVWRCFWDTETSQVPDSAGGTGKTTAEMQTLATFTAVAWDFVGETTHGTADTWQMAGYPVLSRFALVTRHDLTVASGTGGNSYAVRSVVRVTADPASVGTRFARWVTDPAEYAPNLADDAADSTAFTMPAANVALGATYVPKTYTVTFDLDAYGTRTGGGELVQTVTHGEAAVVPEFTVDCDWEFTGWDSAFGSVTSDLTVTARYAELDTDTDYLTDWWEHLHFGDLAQNRDGDPDDDGFTNWEEYVVGTDPDDDQSYPRDRATLVWQDGVHKLRIIGKVLERYMDDHGPDVLPGRLMYLVDEGYLDADMLLAIGDESGGTDPHPYLGDVYEDVSEEGVSFFYEMSEAYCPWTFIGYPHTSESTWYDIKMYQLAHGRDDGPYDRRAFPIVRLFWLVDDMPSIPNPKYRTTINLAMDCRTVFAASANIWEDQSDAYLPEGPAVLGPLPETAVVAQYGVPLSIPLWFAVKDVADTHGLRLVASGGTRDAGIIGEIRGHYYTVTPDIDTPTTFTVTVEWDDETGAAQQASFDVALDSGPGDDPDEDGLDNTAELAAGTDPYDPESHLTVAFAASAASVVESAGTATIRCQLSGVSTLPATVDYAVTGGTATGGGVDYTLADGTLTFAAGASEAILELTTADDSLPELRETVEVHLARPTNAILGTTVLFTQTIVDDDPHTVTFDLGAYGTRAGGGELSQQVAHGDAAAAPEFLVDHGWSFVGWDHEFTEVVADLTVAAQYARTTYALVVDHGSGDGSYPEGTSVAVQADVASAGRYFAGWVAEPTAAAGNLADPGQASTTFSIPDYPVTLTATYGYTDPDWAVPLTLAGAVPATLTFGMHAAATDGWDAGLDEQYPLPGPGQACLASDDLALSYSADFQAVAETGEFLLLVSAATDTPAVVSWAPPALPDGKYLSIYEVTLGDVAPEREAVPRGLVGNTALNMARSSSLTVPAGETRGYAIRYGDGLVFDLAFEPGWNLVSLPIEPSSPALEAVLADGEVLRDGLRGTIYSGDVCTWTGHGYGAAAELHACIGYWVCVEEALVVLVEGQPVGQTDLPLTRGWNQCGVATTCPVPDDARIVGKPWAWNPRSLRYEPVSVFRPGLGYWINAREAAIVPLAAE